MAVGYTDSSVVVPLIESWDGTTWSVVPSPDVGGNGGILTGVSCFTSDQCVAVGHADGGGIPIVETWDGSNWSITPTPASVSGVLTGVSCDGPSDCVAVGWGGGQTYSQTLIEAWDGSSWSVVPSPSVPGSGGPNNYLSGVSCTDGGNECMAVGDYANGDSDHTLIESWDGATWSIVPSPSPVAPKSSNPYDTLLGVSCIDANDCVAAGDYALNTLVESWNGVVWSIVPSPTPSISNRPFYSSQLFGVSCSGPNSCAAVGTERKKHTSSALTLVEAWNGTSWSVIPSPDPGASYSQLFGVSCVDYCYAGGTFVLASGFTSSLVETNVPLTITNTSLPAGTVGQTYTASLEVSSGNPPYKWTVVSGHLPRGLTLNKATGLITGTPTAKSATSTFTIEVVDSKVGDPKARNLDTALLTISINP